MTSKLAFRGGKVFRIPWKRQRPAVVREYAAAFSKAAEGYRELLDHDPGASPTFGRWKMKGR